MMVSAARAKPLAYRTKDTSGGTPAWRWSVEVMNAFGQRGWRAVGHVRRVVWEHYLPFYGGECLGSTMTLDESAQMVRDRAQGV